MLYFSFNARSVKDWAPAWSGLSLLLLSGVKIGVTLTEAVPTVI